MINEIYYHKVTIHCTDWNTSTEGTIIREGTNLLDVSLAGTSLTFYKKNENTYVANKGGVEFVIYR